MTIDDEISKQVEYGLALATEDEILSKAMSILGKRKSERKTLSCRANAKLPRKRVCKKSIVKPKIVLDIANG